MKNITVSVFENPFELVSNSNQFQGEHIIELLETKRAMPIGKTEKERWGFVDIDGQPCHPMACGYMIAIQKQERVLPGWAVTDALNERVSEWEKLTGDTVSAISKREMKDELIIDMLPKAFIRKTVVHAWLGKDRLLIDSKLPAVCDAITSLLREALGSLPCINVAPRSVPGAVMAGWLQDSAMLPQPFELVGETNLRAQEDETGKIKIKDADLHPESISDALECCPMVSDMALSHNDAISFTLNENLQLSKIKLSDTLSDQLDDCEGDKAAEQRATWLLEVTAINAALTDIFAAMNGL